MIDHVRANAPAAVRSADRPHPGRPARRVALVAAAPIAAYAAVRPEVASDAVGLAIAGAIPVVYALGVAARRRTIDPIAVLMSAGFAFGLLAALLLGGGSLPLKLHEAAVTFVVGTTLLVGAMIRRPIPVGRLLQVPTPTPELERRLGAAVGGFLVVHALVHLALALTLTTTSYLVVSRPVNWATIIVGGLCLSGYLRRLRQPKAARTQASVREGPGDGEDVRSGPGDLRVVAAQAGRRPV